MSRNQGGIVLVASQEARRSVGGGGPEVSTRRDLRLLLVDDHPAVRMGLQRLLEEEPDFEVVATCVTGENAVSQAEATEVDVAVVDYHLGGHNGLWVSRKLKHLPRPPRVIILSAFANDHLAANCIVASADAILNKGSLGSELCDLIRSVAHGVRALPSVPQPMADMLRRRLEGTEQQIFELLLIGISRLEIVGMLGISPDELESRQTTMLNKLEALPGERANPRGPALRPEPAGTLAHQKFPDGVDFGRSRSTCG
jgi:two-component system, NarL family, response regulator DevR